MATTPRAPKPDSAKRYHDLVRDMERSVQAVEAKERDLLMAANQLKGSLNSIPGVTDAQRSAAESSLNRAYGQITRLQQKRADAMQRMITKAETAYRVMMDERANHELRSPVAAARQSMDFTKLLKAIQRAMGRQIDTSLDLLRKTEAQLSEVRSSLTQQITDAVNAAFKEHMPAVPAMANAVAKALGAAKPSAPEIPDSAALGDMAENTPNTAISKRPESAVERATNAAKKPAKAVVSPVKSGDDYDLDDYKDRLRSTYQSLKELNVRNRIVTALETLAKRTKRAAKMTMWSVLGGLGGAALGSLMGGLWAPLKALMTALSPARIVAGIRTVLGAVESKVIELAKAGQTKVVELFEWAKGKGMGVLEKGKSILERIAHKLGIGTEAKTAAQAGTGLGTVPKGGTGTAPTTVVGKAMNWVKGNFVKAGQAVASGAKWVGGHAMNAGNRTMQALSRLGTSAWRYTKAAGSMMLDSIARLGNTPVGKFVSKWGNRLGNLGMIFSTIAGIYEEAEGKRVNDLDVWDVIFNPMKGGRYLGARFNEMFERTAGTSLGSWIYDMVNDDAGFAQASSEWAKQRLAQQYRESQQKYGTNDPTFKPTTVSKAVPTVPPPAPSAPSAPVQSVVRVPQKTAASATPSVVASSIPDFAGSDHAMMGINLHVLGGAMP